MQQSKKGKDEVHSHIRVNKGIKVDELIKHSNSELANTDNRSEVCFIMIKQFFLSITAL